jgi:hypothetical protein
MVLYGSFLFSIGAFAEWYLFDGLAYFDHFQERHESTFSAQVYPVITPANMLECHPLETWKS